MTKKWVERLAVRWEDRPRLWKGPRLSRRWRIVRNGAAVGFILLVYWGLRTYPLPTQEAEFRRLERASLVPHTEIVVAIEKGESGYQGTGENRVYIPGQIRSRYVGVGDGYVVSAWIHHSRTTGHFLRWWTLDELKGEAKVVPLLGSFDEWRPEVEPDLSSTDVRVGVAAVCLPDGAVRGEMEIQGEREMRWAWSPVEHNACLFALEPEPHDLGENVVAYSGDWAEGKSYTLRLYGESGTLILEQSGTVPEY